MNDNQDNTLYSNTSRPAWVVPTVVAAAALIVGALFSGQGAIIRREVAQ